MSALCFPLRSLDSQLSSWWHIMGIFSLLSGHRVPFVLKVLPPTRGESSRPVPCAFRRSQRCHLLPLKLSNVPKQFLLNLLNGAIDSFWGTLYSSLKGHWVSPGKPKTKG